MDVFFSFLSEYGPSLLATLVTAVAGFFGMVFKRLYERYVTTLERERIVATVVKAVEQLYDALSGEEKLEKALSSSREMLSEHGITVTDLELRMLIEAAVTELKQTAK